MNTLRNAWLPRFASMVFAMALVACATSASFAENVISVGYGEGSPGDVDVPVIVTARNDVAIHGYSISLSFPKDVIDVSVFDITGTNVEEDEPEFVASRIDNELGIASIAVILNYGEVTEPRAVPSSGEAEAQRIVARLRVDVHEDAPGGPHAIQLIDGLGQPPAFNRFTNAGVSIEPTLEDGTFYVIGGNRLALDKRFAFFGSQGQIEFFAWAQHPEDLAGYQVAFNFDCTKLRLIEGTYEGTAVGDILGRNGQVEFFESDVDDTIDEVLCRSRTGAIFDYIGPFDGQVLPASPDTEQSLVRYVMVQEPGIERDTEHLDLRMDERPGELNSAFLVDVRSIDPHLVHGKIYFSMGSVTGRVVDIQSGEPIRGCTVTLDPDGLRATTGIDGTFSVDDVIPGDYSVRLTRGGHYMAFHSGFSVTGNGGVEDWGTMGMYSIPSNGSLFLRGTSNGDGRVDISDSVWILNWLFTSGPPPVCLIAADSNADNRNDISDAIYLLNYLFNGGPPPTQPFPECGPIDTSSRLSCDVPPPCAS